MWNVCPVMASTGCLSILASYRPLSSWMPPRAASSHAIAQPAGELGVPAGDERGCLLVPHQDVPQLVRSRPQRLEEPVDAVAWKAEDRIDVSIHEAVQEDVRRGSRHDRTSSLNVCGPTVLRVADSTTSSFSIQYGIFVAMIMPMIMPSLRTTCLDIQLRDEGSDNHWNRKSG